MRLMHFRLSDLTDWLGVAMAAVAIIVAVWIAWKVAKQTERLADRDNALASEAYTRDRMQDLVSHAKETVEIANRILRLTSPRSAELIGGPAYLARTLDERRDQVVDDLAGLESRVQMLRTFALTMPTLSSEGQGEEESALDNLMDEGAWLYSTAFYCANIAFAEDPAYSDDSGLDVSDTQSVVDVVMNGIFVNLDTRLLSACKGLDPDQVPAFRDPGSPWPRVYEARERLLGETLGSRMFSTVAEAAAVTLDATLSRYSDALISVLGTWGRRSA